MTPLLWHLLNDYNHLPDDDRPAEVLKAIKRVSDDLHCFECSAVVPLLNEITESARAGREQLPEQRFAFLPAPATWIEFTTEGHHKTAFLVSGETDFAFNSVVQIIAAPERGYPGAYKVFKIDLGGLPKSPLFWNHTHWRDRIAEQAGKDTAEVAGIASSNRLHLLWLLAAINQPQITNLKVHPPHKGRAKKLTGLGFGKFPLRAWNEIVVGRPTRDMGGQEVQNQVADKRPLHFVRSHLKPSIGVRVPAHWRGNAAYGIKLTRYKVER